MTAPRPLCRYCGKPIAKRTRTVFFGRQQQKLDDYWSERTEKPRSKQEAQRLLNAEIVSVSWSAIGDDDGNKYVHKVTTWDGVRYVDPYFCNGSHAQKFAYACANMTDRTLAMPEYFTALAKQKEAAGT